MKAIFLSGHLQSDLHTEQTEERRLKEFIELLADEGLTPSFPSEDELENEIKDSALLIATTRKTEYPAPQLEYILNAVKNGSPLLHLSNHRPFPLHDNKLAVPLGYEFYNNFLVNDLVTVNQNDKPIEPLNFELTTNNLPGFSSKSPVAISVCDCCSIKRMDDRFVQISTLPDNCVGLYSRETAHGQTFAIACDKSDESGRIVAMGDSGLIGAPDRSSPRNPGPGLGVADNRTAIAEVIKWLIS